MRDLVAIGLIATLGVLTLLASSHAPMSAVRTLRLVCPEFWADVRVREVSGRWLASADTPDGPSLGVGRYPLEALSHALEPFDGYADELLATVPDDLYWR